MGVIFVHSVPLRGYQHDKGLRHESHFCETNPNQNHKTRICNELRNDWMWNCTKRTQMIHEFHGSHGWGLRDRTMPNESSKHSTTPSLLPATLCLFYETNPNDEIVTCLMRIGYITTNKFFC